MKIRDRLQHAWNAFNKKSEDDAVNYQSESFSYGSGVYKNQHRFISHKSIITSLYNRISIDVSSISIKHVRLTEEGQYAGDIKSNLNECLTVSANKDQTYRAFIQDLVLSLFDEGVVAVVPVDMTVDPKLSNSWDVTSMRVGKITQWYPDKVRILVYNEKIGQKQEITMDKKMVAIIENPLYAVMNEPNGTLKRLLRKIELLDDVEEKAASTKLDLIIQLPYQIRSESKKLQAETRKQENGGNT